MLKKHEPTETQSQNESQFKKTYRDWAMSPHLSDPPEKNVDDLQHAFSVPFYT